MAISFIRYVQKTLLNLKFCVNLMKNDFFSGQFSVNVHFSKGSSVAKSLVLASVWSKDYSQQGFVEFYKNL